MNIVMAKVGRRDDDGKYYWIVVFEDEGARHGFEDDIETAFGRVRAIFERNALPEESEVGFLRGARHVPLPWERPGLPDDAA
jgi:hypothetical protein